MAITVGTVTTGASDALTTTVAATVAATSYPLLLVFVGLGNSSASSQIDTVKWNTTESLTRIGTFVDDGNDEAIEAWYINNPSTGTHNIVVDYTGSTTPDAGVAVIPIYGVDNTDPIGAYDTDTGTNSSGSTTVATEADNSWVFDGWGVEDDTNPGFSGGAGQVELFDILGGEGAGDFCFGGSYKETTTHGNITSTQTFAGGSALYVGIAVEIKAAATGEFNASVSPVTIGVTLPAVTATYQSILSASVSPVNIGVTLPAVTANTDIYSIAIVEPIGISFTIPEVTAVYIGPVLALVSPVTIGIIIPEVTAGYWIKDNPANSSYSKITPTSSSWTKVTPTFTSHSQVTPTNSSWTKVTPANTSWS